MKYSGAIANLIKKRKFLKVYEFDGMQWIGDGAVLYPVFGMRGLSDKELVHFLDLDPSEIEVQHIKELALDLSANDDFECLITDRGPDVFQGIAWCRTYYTEQGAIFLNSRYFTPVERDKSFDMPVDVYLRTADRDNKKFPYVVLKKRPVCLRGYLSDRYMVAARGLSAVPEAGRSDKACPAQLCVYVPGCTGRSRRQGRR